MSELRRKLGHLRRGALALALLAGLSTAFTTVGAGEPFSIYL